MFCMPIHLSGRTKCFDLSSVLTKSMWHAYYDASSTYKIRQVSTQTPEAPQSIRLVTYPGQGLWRAGPAAPHNYDPSIARSDFGIQQGLLGRVICWLHLNVYATSKHKTETYGIRWERSDYLDRLQSLLESSYSRCGLTLL